MKEAGRTCFQQARGSSPNLTPERITVRTALFCEATMTVNPVLSSNRLLSQLIHWVDREDYNWQPRSRLTTQIDTFVT